MRIFIVILAFSISNFIVQAQGSAGETAKYESRYILDLPTVGLVPKGHYTFYSSVYTEGGLLLELSAAIFDNFNMGLSMSGQNIVGSGHVTWQKYPGIQLRYRLVDEKDFIPAFTIGVSTQGRGVYDKEEQRSETLAPGIFLASSKSFKWFLGSLSLHGGLSYPFEEKRDTKNPNVYIGMEQSLGNSFSFNLEYNSNLDDNNQRFLDKRGLVNVGFRWAVATNLTLELQLRDVLDNQKQQNNEFTRYIVFEYISPF